MRQKLDWSCVVPQLFGNPIAGGLPEMVRLACLYGNGPGRGIVIKLVCYWVCPTRWETDKSLFVLLEDHCDFKRNIKPLYAFKTNKCCLKLTPQYSCNKCNAYLLCGYPHVLISFLTKLGIFAEIIFGLFEKDINLMFQEPVKVPAINCVLSFSVTVEQSVFLQYKGWIFNLAPTKLRARIPIHCVQFKCLNVGYHGYTH